MGEIAKGFRRADDRLFTKKPPLGVQARVNFLLKKAKGSTKKVAQDLGVSQESVRRYAKGQRKNPPKDIAGRIEAEVRGKWQPRVRAAAKKKAAATGGVTIHTRAQFGFSAAGGSTDDPRLRQITQYFPPAFAAALFDAQESGASEDQIQEMIAEGLRETYFEGSMDEVEFSSLDFIEFGL